MHIEPKYEEWEFLIFFYQDQILRRADEDGMETKIWHYKISTKPSGMKASTLFLGQQK